MGRSVIYTLDLQDVGKWLGVVIKNVLLVSTSNTKYECMVW